MRVVLAVIFSMLCISYAGDTSAQDAVALTSYPDCAFTTSEDASGLQLGAVVLDFKTRLGCVQNLDHVFNVASVPKIFVAAAYYDGVLNRTLSGTGTLEFTANYWMGGSNDCLSRDELGNRYTYEELIELMINCSDNAATWMLMDSIGWGRVNDYVQSLGIDNIGEVIPYSEVDRLKLEFLDERWADVPSAIASRFYRNRDTSGLLQYFTEIPQRPNRDQFVEINQRYFDEYSYNTMTPYAMAEFILLMRDHLLSGTPEQMAIASRVMNVMLYTQRQYSTQSLPGNIYIASKNGFDRGLLAETNILFDDLDTRIPSGMVLLFGQYEALAGGDNNSQLPNRFGDALNDIFFELSPDIRDILYPNFRQPPVQNSFVVTTVILNDQPSITSCWNPFFSSGFDPALVATMENCFNNLRPRVTYPAGQNLALGIILRNLNFADTRMTFLFTAPDNRQFSYQQDRQNVTSSGVYRFHPIDLSGQWQVDIYVNLIHAYSETIIAQR